MVFSLDGEDKQASLPATDTTATSAFRHCANVYLTSRRITLAVFACAQSLPGSGELILQ